MNRETATPFPRRTESIRNQRGPQLDWRRSRSGDSTVVNLLLLLSATALAGAILVTNRKVGLAECPATDAQRQESGAGAAASPARTPRERFPGLFSIWKPAPEHEIAVAPPPDRPRSPVAVKASTVNPTRDLRHANLARGFRSMGPLSTSGLVSRPGFRIEPRPVDNLSIRQPGQSIGLPGDDAGELLGGS